MDSTFWGENTKLIYLFIAQFTPFHVHKINFSKMSNKLGALLEKRVFCLKCQDSQFPEDEFIHGTVKITKSKAFKSALFKII